MLIILRIHYQTEEQSRTPHTTIPMGLILNKDICLTVCHYETNMMLDFVSYQQKRNLGFTDSVDFVFRLFLSSAVWYLKRLKQISTIIDAAKRDLDRPINNADLINLSRLQDSLTYFATSIRGNEMLLSKLKFKLHVDEHLHQHLGVYHRHLRGHHQQQHEPHDEDDDLAEHHPHVPHAHRQHLRDEPHQRHGALGLGIPTHHRSLHLRHPTLLLVFP